ADLLWYPTGGGKTEAYLGLSAYVMGLRRLQGEIGGRTGEYGVAVLMRYTLRLLTLQQFQRATALICACEMIRRETLGNGDERWGREPFRIGLWVGQRMTPNSTEQSAEAVRQDHGQFHHGSAIGGVGSPAQLTNCPWCGEKIDPGRDIKVETFAGGRARTLIHCGDQLGHCEFSRRKASGEGLPVMVVDEEIYRRLPSLLIATVDKFAQMPWNGATEMLFGQVDGYCERHGFRSSDIDDTDSHPARHDLPRAKTVAFAKLRPPDLVIQDELHLISGPLGTLFGLYETAVDDLTTWEVDGNQVRPKVIASTATIRRAPDQVHALFRRKVSVFPPHGLDVEDNFFAKQREPSEKYPGRKYVGICASGRRLKAALIRVYVAHLAAAQFLYEKYGRGADPWMTLVGYFNSMRELGGMRRLVDDDIRSRLAKMDLRSLATRRPPVVEELTSRKGSTDIPLVLDRLETVFDPDDEARRRAKQKAGERVETPTPIDVLLATNMISVGVDVPRLGLMVVGGQPKATAEYIQATSRVGRQFPGLVYTVFNWARPRDLSHYERFEHYHATFYQQVEALSVTPFAPRALDRGLTALLVSQIRLRGREFNGNGRAGSITSSHPYIQEAIKAITDRAWAITCRTDIRDLVEGELKERLDKWLAEAQRTTGGRVLGYKDKKDGVTVGLLRAPSFDSWDTFTCLNSLRDVEPTVALILEDHGLDDEPSSQGAGSISAASS
ncbi:MAG: DISARM system helicase DrmA, partial [Chloroflexi bacterium]|nr:DISARM system helicase DrmA [Chloroflexota bacterium]